MIPATPASRPDTIPSSKDFLNIRSVLFCHWYGELQLDIVVYFSAWLADVVVIAVDGKAAGKGAACPCLFKGKGDGYGLFYSMHFQVACCLVAAACLGDAAGSEFDSGIFGRVKPLVAFGVFVLQGIARIDRGNIDRNIEAG